ncbi:hypothetical protein TSAR_006276 [Trichomalopsis sarcophagae]|uniref:Uncharacterized protein n=1 Tax=Trichomalopsis sarcophagae TaxID=543379 RepID=A0A232EDU2_9HYME|nr:hypothetical protein TSAR_006276 [Trichomalopsis sarcophagae]
MVLFYTAQLACERGDEAKRHRRLLVRKSYPFVTKTDLRSTCDTRACSLIKWRGSAAKASLRSRRSRGVRDTIYFYIGVWIFHDTEKNAYHHCSWLFLAY